MLMPTHDPKRAAMPEAVSLTALAHPVRVRILQPDGANILPTAKEPTSVTPFQVLGVFINRTDPKSSGLKLTRAAA